MKKIILSLIIISNTLVSFSQWEFNYFVVKLGANHHAFSKQPLATNTLFLNTPEGSYRLLADSVFFPDYVIGFQGGFDFHFDFANDMGGIIIGAEYINMGVSSKYSTINNKAFNLIQTHRINSISIPLLIKFGNEIFDQQKYFFAGARFNINFGLYTTDVVDYVAIEKTSYQKDLLFENNSIGFCAGFNILVFNFELCYYPNTFLDKEYTVNLGTPNDNFIVKIFENQPDNLLYLKTSLYVPISSWTTSKSFFMHNFIRLFK